MIVLSSLIFELLGGACMNLGEQIKHRLKLIDKSQRWLAHKTKISPAKINLVINGKRELSIAELQWICWAFKMEIGDMLRASPPGKTNEDSC